MAAPGLEPLDRSERSNLTVAPWDLDYSSTPEGASSRSPCLLKGGSYLAWPLFRAVDSSAS